MKRLIIVIFMAGFITSAGWAQSKDTEVEQIIKDVKKDQTEQMNNETIFYLDNYNFTDLKASVVPAAGNFNQVAEVYTYGNNNTVRLTQLNGPNIGVIKIYGNGNDASLYQMGSSLFSFIKIDGNQNDLDVDQVGNDLQHLIKLKGNGIDFHILHNNTGITLTQRGGNAAAPLKITTSSGRVPIVIKNGK